jgi:hypothetical protein
MRNKNTKIIAAFGGTFFLASASIFAGFYFMLSKQEREYAMRSLGHAQAEASRASLSALEKHFEDTENERAYLVSRIPKEENVIQILSLIETLGKDQGVALTTNSLTIKPINERFEILMIDIITKGPYGGVLRTLKLLERLPYQTNIVGLQMTRSFEETDEWQASYKILITKFKKI